MLIQVDHNENLTEPEVKKFLESRGFENIRHEYDDMWFVKARNKRGRIDMISKFDGVQVWVYRDSDWS